MSANDKSLHAALEAIREAADVIAKSTGPSETLVARAGVALVVHALLAVCDTLLVVRDDLMVALNRLEDE